LPAISVTAVLTVTAYVVDPFCELVENTAWLPEQPESDKLPEFIITFVVFTVAQSTFSFQFMTMSLFKATLVAPSGGKVEITAGADLSIVTVFPAEGVSILLEESVPRLWIVWLPSAGRVQL
jgi:hypothetical protein